MDLFFFTFPSPFFFPAGVSKEDRAASGRKKIKIVNKSDQIDRVTRAQPMIFTA